MGQRRWHCSVYHLFPNGAQKEVGSPCSRCHRQLLLGATRSPYLGNRGRKS